MNLKPKEFYIKVNDVFVDLNNENKRLNKELNNCLIVLNKFKLFLSKICLKFESNIDSEDKQELNQLKEEFNLIKKSKSKYRKYRKTNVLIDDNISENNGNNDDLDYEIPEDESVLSGNESTDSDKVSDTRKGSKRSKRLESKSKSKTKPKVNAKQEPKEESQQFKCDFIGCGFETKHKRNLKLHKEIHSNDRSFECDICEKSYKTSESLRFHKRYSHSTLPKFVCDYEGCVKRFKDRYKLRVHIQGKHLGKSYKCTECDFETKNSLILSHHLRRHKEKTSFQCNVCKNLFKENHELRYHKLIAHTTGPGHIVCPHEGCNRLFKHQRVLSIHIRFKHTLDKPFKCTECGKAFAVKYLLRKHQKDVHLIHTVEERKLPKFAETFDETTERYVCPFPSCDKSYTNRSVLIRHFNETHDPNYVISLFRCDFIGCGFETRHESNLKNHKQIHSNDRSFQCDICEKSFSSKDTLRGHKRDIHSTHPDQINAAQFACNYEGCVKRFKYKHYLDFHVRQKHTNDENKTEQNNLAKSFNCTECEKTFTTSYYLRIHKFRIHSDKGNAFVCEECHAIFRYEYKLEKHKVIHSMNRQIFSCNFCDFKTYSKASLRDHVKFRHTITEKTVKCDFEDCSKMFKDNRKMRQHKRIVHVNESQRFVCEWPGCEQTFKSKGSCDEHKSSHLGKRDFVCDVEGCGKAFMRVGTLAAHKRSHLKSAVCAWPECGHRFSNNYQLSAHMNIHLNVKPFKCTINGCEQKFFSKDSRKQHLKNFHKI